MFMNGLKGLKIATYFCLMKHLFKWGLIYAIFAGIIAPLSISLKKSTSSKINPFSFYLNDHFSAPDFAEFERIRTSNPLTGDLPSELRYQNLPGVFTFSLLKDQKLNKWQKFFPNSWVPVNDFFASLAVSKIAFNPLNPSERYFATGEGWFNADAARGAGIWKSTDAGITWTQLSATLSDTFFYCQDLMVHPKTGHVYVATREGGLRRSKDGGLSFEEVLSSQSGARSDRAADLEIDNSGGIWISFGIFSPGEIFFSENGDPNTWQPRTNGLPSNIQRIEIAVAPSDRNRLYCIPINTGDRKISGVYRSDDRGMSWTETALPGGDRDLANVQGWYDLIVEVDPNNKDVVVVGGLNLFRSRNGGDTWQQLCEGDLRKQTSLQYVHVDQHEVYFVDSDQVYFTNDGGIYRCDRFTADTPVIYAVNDNYNVTQYYTVATYPQKADYRVLGGTQDNGTYRSTGAGISDFEKLSWADGGFCEVNPKNLTVFTTTQNRRIYRFSEGRTDTLTNPSVQNANTLFINPLHLDPVDPEILYQASNMGLWRLKNASVSDSNQWERACAPTGQISALGFSENIPHIAFIGLWQNGLVYRLNNCHNSSSDTRTVFIDKQKDLPPGYVSSISVDPTDANHVVLSFSNYGIEKVYRSRNALSDDPRWESCNGNFPDLPVRWIMLHPERPNVCYLATENGVYYTDQLQGASTVWKTSNAQLPNLRMDMIRYRKSDQSFVLGSHGRGIFTGVHKSGSNEIVWTERGPRNIGGRTRTILKEPLDPAGKKFWTGSVSGGLWYINNIDSVSVFDTLIVREEVNRLRLYPNPLKGSYLNLEITSELMATGSLILEFYSLLGQKIYAESLLSERKQQIQLPKLGSGLYLVTLRQGDEIIAVEKLILD